MRIPDRAGDYDQRITIQKLKDAPTTNDFGEVDKSNASNWETYANRWAEIEPVGGREQLRGGQTTPIGLYRVRMRSDSISRAITADMRIKWGDRYLNLETDAVDKKSKKREVELTAKESQ